MKIQIKRWDNDAVIFETDAETIGAAVVAAVAAKIDLYRASLDGASLDGARLVGARLVGASLDGARLVGARLDGARLDGASLVGARLDGASLDGASLVGASLDKKQLEMLLPKRTILPQGDLIGWKKLAKEVICKLKIPAKAKRVGGLMGRKCRAEYAVVVSGNGYSMHNPDFKYTKGKTVRPDRFDPNPLVECSSGIHFFITREEAEAFQL